MACTLHGARDFSLKSLFCRNIKTKLERILATRNSMVSLQVVAYYILVPWIYFSRIGLIIKLRIWHLQTMKLHSRILFTGF